MTYTAQWHDPWEPFYIARTAAVPDYDERFKQYGFNLKVPPASLSIARQLSFSTCRIKASGV